MNDPAMTIGAAPAPTVIDRALGRTCAGVRFANIFVLAAWPLGAMLWVSETASDGVAARAAATAFASFFLATIALSVRALGDRSDLARTYYRLLWAAACSVFLVHAAVTFHEAFDWKFARMRTAFGPLIAWFNVIIPFVWSADATLKLVRTGPSSRAGRVASCAVAIAVLIGFLQATIRTGSAQAAMVGWTLGITIGGAWAVWLIRVAVRRLRAGEQAARHSG